MMKNETIFTIGHSNHPHDKFIQLLKDKGIGLVIDVRSNPFSKYVFQYNKEILESTLKINGIDYKFFGNYLGARPEDNSLYDEEGKVDFQKVQDTNSFKEGISQLLKMVNQNISLMCTERDPLDCHRFVLVSKYLSERCSLDVKHITEKSDLISNAELEKKLLDRYNLRQQTLFNEKKSVGELLDEAYKARNKDIAYSLKVKVG